MSNVPPPLPGAKNLRWGMALNAFLPGAGLFYLGQRTLGFGLAAAFLTSFVAVLTLFLVGYSQYLQVALGDNLLEGDKLEQIGAGFHSNWLLGLGAFGGVIYLVSFVLFHRAKRRFEQPGKSRG